MECKFVVGQKVVCIADGWHACALSDGLPTGAPVKDGIYKIRKIEALGGTVMLHLYEIPGHRWHHTGFRPLQDRPKEADTDIGVFLPALNTKTLEQV